MSVTVLLVDDQSLMRDGLRLILESTSDITVVGEAADGSDVVDLVEYLDPDLVLMDIRMTGVDGITATREIVRCGHRARVLILTTYDLDEHLFEAVRAGACGFLLKTAPAPQLIATIRAAANGDTVLAPELTRRLLERFADAPGAQPAAASALLDRLSEREVEVFRLLGAGLTNEEIATSLYISAATVKSHVHSLFRKLQARDRVHAVILAYESGIAGVGGFADDR